MKRSNEPIFWVLFGAGGMLAALIGPALVLITGIAVPFGLIYAPDTMDYAHMQAFAQNWLGKCLLFAVVSLFLWHAVHRIAILVHDLGVHARTLTKLLCYGFALAGTLVTAYALLLIGF
jgi:fumarate reductase subunit D